MIQAFSVIVPVLNKEKEIIRTLESIEASIAFFHEHYDGASPVEAEVIVVNDGSTDRTLELVTTFCQNYPHYKVISHFQSIGAGAARNTGAKVSRGDILFFCDGDDLFFQEHIYLCFRLLNHEPQDSVKADSESFLLTSDRGSFSIELPQQSIGIVRTGVYMQDSLHPYWKAAIENSIPLNLCVRRECHEFVEGFPEASVYKQIGCEDISYGLWVTKFFKQSKVDLETVEYIRYPGNNFDRQLQKFQTPPENYQEQMPPEKLELHTIRRKLEQEHFAYLLDKFKRFDQNAQWLTIANWQPIASEYLNQQKYLDCIRLCEQGLAIQPSAIENVKNLLAVACNNLGSACHQQGDLAQAVDYFKQAIAVNPTLAQADLAKLHFNVATVLKSQQAFPEALNFLQKALELEPHLSEALTVLPAVQYQVEIAQKGYQFSQDWFSHNIPIWQQYLSQFVGMPGLKVLEIGSWEGRSTCWLIDHVLTHESARITCVDTFEGGAEHQTYADGYLKSIEERFDFNIEQTRHPEKVRKLVGKSQVVLRSLIPNGYQLVYIDGSHIASDVLEDTLLTWGLVQVGGVIIFDDYGFQFPQTIEENPPKVALDMFLTVFKKKINLRHQGYQIILEKIAA